MWKCRHAPYVILTTDHRSSALLLLSLYKPLDMADRSSTPLLQSYHGDDSDEAPAWHRRSQESSFSRHLRRCRRTSQRFLESRTKHFLVMGTVALDVAALLANIFIQLIACEMDEKDEPWVEDITEGLEIAGLVFSSLFLLELVACLFAFGPR